MQVNGEPSEDHISDKTLCTARCYVRNILSGIALFGISFSAVYFAQLPVLKRISTVSIKPEMRLVLPTLMSSAFGYSVTTHKINTCHLKHLCQVDRQLQQK